MEPYTNIHCSLAGVLVLIGGEIDAMNQSMAGPQ
jgi:hypothetical protein